MDTQIENPARPPEKIDLIGDSITHLVVVSFAKTTSKNYSLAVNLAEGAAKYNLTKIGKTDTHLAAFSGNQEQAARAHTLLKFISGWKNTHIVAGGKMLQNHYSISQVLECYLEAAGCNDHRAHCHTIINDPYSEHPNAWGTSFTINVSLNPKPEPEPIYIDRYTFPCKNLFHFFKFQTDHPSTPEDQIQAGAVKRGCDACPYFNPNDYGKTGQTVKAKQ